MGNENYCLRLGSFHANIRSTWQQLQNEDNFCDMTLACDDKQIKAHKIVVSSSSPVLGNILKSNSNPQPFIYLRGVKFEDLVNLVNFMYQGEVNIVQDNLGRFLSTAEDLQVKGLSELKEEPFQSEYYKNDVATDTKRKRYEDSNYDYHGNEKSESAYDYLQDHNIENMGEKFIQTDKIKEIDTTELEQSKFVINKQNVDSLVEDGSFPCNQCDKSFTLKSSLHRHKESLHEGIRYTCDKCDYKATQKTNLKNHIAAVHEGIRYPCSHCEFTATFKGDVARHVKKCH